MPRLMFSVIFLLLAFALADNADLCKLSTKVNGIQLDYDINILKREFDVASAFI